MEVRGWGGYGKVSLSTWGKLGEAVIIVIVVCQWNPPQSEQGGDGAIKFCFLRTCGIKKVTRP